MLKDFQSPLQAVDVKHAWQCPPQYVVSIHISHILEVEHSAINTTYTVKSPPRGSITHTYMNGIVPSIYCVLEVEYWVTITCWVKSINILCQTIHQMARQTDRHQIDYILTLPLCESITTITSMNDLKIINNLIRLYWWDSHLSTFCWSSSFFLQFLFACFLRLLSAEWGWGDHLLT